jgi:hypothetical protein
MIDFSGVNDDIGMLSRIMTSIHGPLLAGDILSKALGYSSDYAFYQASFRGTLPITLMDFPKRKLRFALSAEVAQWIIGQRIEHCEKKLCIELSAVEAAVDQLRLFILDRGYLLHEDDLLELMGLETRDELILREKESDLPFGLFTIDNRRTKRFALSIEAFSTFCDI